MFDFLSNIGSQVGKFGADIAKNRLAGGSLASYGTGTLSDYIKKAYPQSSPQTNISTPQVGVSQNMQPTVQPVSSSALQYSLGSTPSVADTMFQPSGSKGIKKIIGMAVPYVGMAIAKHDEHQAKQQSFNKSMDNNNEPLYNPFTFDL